MGKCAESSFVMTKPECTRAADGVCIPSSHTRNLDSTRFCQATRRWSLSHSPALRGSLHGQFRPITPRARITCPGWIASGSLLVPEVLLVGPARIGWDLRFARPSSGTHRSSPSDDPRDPTRRRPGDAQVMSVANQTTLIRQEILALVWSTSTQAAAGMSGGRTG